MLLLLPLLAFLLFLSLCRKLCGDWQRAVLAAFLFCGVSVVVLTETLSAFHQVTRAGVGLSWLGVVIVAFLLQKIVAERKVALGAPTAVENAGGRSAKLDGGTKILLGVGALIAAIIGTTAIVSPPNVWDAMEYHLPRTVMWMSQHSVGFFATPDYSQLMFGPWAEYAMMHLNLLWGNDRFVNLVEFFSFLGTLAGVSWIAKRFGAGVRGQAIAVLVCATIPEGVLEASGPMNTYVVSLWIVATVVFLMSWNDEPSALHAILVGCAAGLAILTKGSSYVYLPFIVLACWWMGTPTARIRWLKWCWVFLVCILALNAPQYFRCYELTGSPLGLPFPDGGPRLHWMVDRISLQGTLANALRNASIHTFTPVASWNEQIEQGVRTAIRTIGADPDDPAMVWPGYHFELNHFSVHELHAGNPLHFLLFLMTLILLAIKRKSLVNARETWIYAFGIIAAFVMFCTLLRWQTWISRHHLPLFVLSSVLIGLAMEHFFGPRVTTAILGLLAVYALTFSLVNRTRSFVRWSRVDSVYHPRDILYFNDQHAAIAAANNSAADFVNRTGCKNVAIDSYTEIPASEISYSPRSFFVYPIMALIHADARIRTVWYSGVENLSSRYAGVGNHSAPCAVICLECARVPRKWQEYEGIGGRASVFDYIVVFQAQGALENHGEPPTGIGNLGAGPGFTRP